MSILDSRFLQKLDMLRLAIQGRFSGFRQALHRSKKVGMGITFADHREYTTGDDLRYIDWAMYARSDKLLLKRFEEEEDVPVYVMVDASPSMRWKHPTFEASKKTINSDKSQSQLNRQKSEQPSEKRTEQKTEPKPEEDVSTLSSIETKYDHACQIALAFLYVALSELNTAFLYLSAETVVAEKNRARGKEQIFSFAHFLEHAPDTSQAKTNLAHSLSELLHKTKKPGLLLILSDFYDESRLETSLQALGQQGFEIMLIQLFDPSEADLPLDQEWQLEDAETGEQIPFSLSQQSKDAYRMQQFALSERLQFLSSSVGGSYLQANVTLPFEQFILSQLFS